MSQKGWNTGIVSIKTVKTRGGTEKSGDLKEQISMAGNSRIFPIPHSHLGTHILRAKERGIQKLLHDIAHKSPKTRDL